MKVLLLAVVVFALVGCASKKKEGHDVEHAHVTEAAHHDHDDAHHKDHDHKAHHPEHVDAKKDKKKK